MKPTVSVVIPAYKAQPFIHRTVSSVLKQTWTDWEVVIASDDGVDYARLLRESGVEDPRVRCVLTGGVGTGPSHARNTGLAAAQGRVIATLDGDDKLAPRALEVLVPLALEHGAAYSRALFIDQATGTELESLDRPLGTGPVRLEDILTSQIHTYAGVAFDRSRVKARWPAWMQRWEDVFFFVRCFDDVDSMYHVAEPLYLYHRIQGSICNRPETGQEYLTWTLELLKRLERGDTLELCNASSRTAFWQFLCGRKIIEERFIQALVEGRSTDFHSFTKRNLELFYSLPPAPLLTPRTQENVERAAS